MRWTPLTLLLVPIMTLGEVSTSSAAPSHSARIARQVSGDAPHSGSYVEGEVLVRFRDSSSARSRARSHNRRGARVRATYGSVANLEHVALPVGTTVEEAVEAYRNDPDVEYAEPNYLLEAHVVPNDLRFAELWGMHNTGQEEGVPDADIDAVEAWDVETGSSDVVVAVIDSRMSAIHPELVANLFRNEIECVRNGIDDDLNGWVDDCHGADAISDTGTPTMGSVIHASHVAGTIGARANNQLGVAGVNWDVSILSCRFILENSGATADAVQCLDYIAMMKDRGVNIVATNNSWGGTAFSQALLDAIEGQRERGILFVASAGNAGIESAAQFPAGYYLPNIITVAATTRTDELAGFSNRGATSTHVGAPGQAILSTTEDSYTRLNGTSMAAPHVTGVIALLAAQDPTRDWRALRNLVLASGDGVPALDGTTVTGKRLNANGAVRCTDATSLGRLRPLRDLVVLPAGRTLGLSMLHARCAEPAGEVAVEVTPGGSVLLLDDGAGFDQVAGDGVYSAEWAPPAPGAYTLAFPDGDEVRVRVGSAVITSPDAASGDWYGYAIAADQGRLLIGEPYDDETVADAGAAHLVDAETGMHLLRFSNPSPESFDGFGMVVALDGDLAAIGAPTDSRLSTWVGEVYVFDTTSGALLTTIANPTPIVGSQFGRSLAFVAGNLVVGAPGDPSDTNDSGRVHVFDPRSGVLLGTIMNPGPEPTRANLFGWSMAALGTEVVVSAPVSGPWFLPRPGTGGHVGLGRVFILDADPGSASFGAVRATLIAHVPDWSGRAGITPSFGYTLATSNDYIVVGDPNAGLDDPGDWDPFGTGPSPSSGIAFVFDAHTAELESTLVPPFFQNHSRFGGSAAVHGDHVLVGANAHDVGVLAGGAAHLYEAKTGSLLTTYLHPAPGTLDLYGNAVAFAGSGFVGAPRDDSLLIDGGSIHRVELPTFIDRVKCYKAGAAPGSRKLPPLSVVLEDEIETKQTRVLSASQVCNPATQDGSTLVDAGAYLSCHKIKDVAGQAKLGSFDLRAIGTFGSEHLTVAKSKELCVASRPGSGAPAAGTDHYKCYQAKPTRGAPQFRYERSSDFADAFEAKRALLVKPVAYCTPVAIGSGSVINAGRDLLCYQVKEPKAPAFGRPTVSVSSLLGDEMLATQKTDRICVPAQRIPGD